MARLNRIPRAGSLYSAEASMAGSGNVAIWLGFAAGCPNAGSVMWWRGTASATGSPFLPITACQATRIFGPFIIPEGVYASPAGGCAIYWRE